MKTKRLTLLAVFTAMALVMFVIEAQFPPLFIPGAKMGLSNLFSLFTLVVLGPADALLLVVVRTVLGSFFSGSISTLMYSLSGGLVSIIASILLMRFVFPHISLVAVSIVSAVLHNLTQNLVFCLMSGTPQMYAYMPYLALIGVLAGLLIGLVVHFTLRRIPESILARL